jgi:crotonobetainyl-CoA:carnitine CoA-transferase CaiB-like acyl-CoA transferase
MPGPLTGIRVLDLTRLLPGPFATQTLADLGADVVKVEDPRGGDPLRALPPSVGQGADGAAFHALNHGKRSVALDLSRPEGRDAFLRLCARADAVVESFRPGVLDRLGLGFTALHAAAPRLVLCSLTGYGQDGPYAARAGHDLDYLALSGVLALCGEPGAPSVPGVQVADLAGGAWPAVAGILAALLGRGATGEGVHLDVSMAEGALGLLSPWLAVARARGAPLTRGGEVLGGAAACYGVYRARDGRFAALAALEPRFFEAFCAAVGRPELAERQWEAGDALRAELAAVFAARTRDEWEAFAARHDACVMPVLEGSEPGDDPHLRARQAFVEIPVGDGGPPVLAVATPLRFGRARDDGRAPRPAPRLGEHGEAVLAEAGFTPAELAALRRSGALGP